MTLIYAKCGAHLINISKTTSCKTNWPRSLAYWVYTLFTSCYDDDNDDGMSTIVCNMLS